MTKYENRHGNSGAVAYELEADALVVMFKGGSLYRYAGTTADHMKQLARDGRGLCTFINVTNPPFAKIG